jgi:uncharacterized protein YceK
MRASIYTLGLSVALVLGGCTNVVHLRNAKTGEPATCGGEMWNFGSAARDEHCLKYFHQQGFDPVP